MNVSPASLQPVQPIPLHRFAGDDEAEEPALLGSDTTSDATPNARLLGAASPHSRLRPC